MKKALACVMTGILFLLVLSACGPRSQEDVVSALKKKYENLKSYKAEATMTLNAGEKPSKYDVEIWYKKPDYYRIHLKNTKQDLSQMILKNEEGVFVLTPQLNKSYRFQSNWPKNGSQWYLYESLLRDIIEDPQPAFERGEDTFVFRTKTNYKHSDLQTQKITLSQKDLKPLRVEIMNGDNKTIVDMKFKNMTFDANFDDGAFDLQKNMQSAKMDVKQTMGHSGKKSSFQVLYPTNLSSGTKMSAKKVTMDGTKKYVLQFSGDQPFTLIEQKSQAWSDTVEPATVSGKPVNLGFAIGHMTGNSLSWTYNGTDFFLASKKLTQPQMADIARSVLGKQMK
ncbi:MAG TPA: outer membrane lipoprotein carrier protein LolA [Bacillales bacterium]|nr:outer membrane lipoprotein carrier protein LolA [Bacillales bacterium]